ncbi:MAG: FAD-dependent oxidoreductase [Halobacteria archaeon]|nr:FAD-dependent oxidoreductase [Halobacteria archaeon]
MKQDLVVIGGGPGGLVVASVAAQLGLRVTLVEQSDRLGGDCLHTGCVPSKSLIAMSRIAHATRHGVATGLLSSMPDIDFASAIAHVDRVIGKIQLHDDPERFRSYGCDVRFGKAVFTGEREVVVDEEIIRGRRFLIATGSQPSIPPIPGLDEAGYDTNETIFQRRKLPARLAVIGGGPIGVELAQAFARLGSEVTIVEMADQLLGRMDHKAAETLWEVLEAEGVHVRLSAAIASVRRAGDARQIVLESGETVECDRILVAAGRRPAVNGLGLDAAGVEYDRRGIRVDNRLRTSRRHIYAVGDVCGPLQFTHVAEYQAGVALANIAFRMPKKTDYRVVPVVVYTDPEVAAVGLTEQQAGDKGIRYEVAEFPMADIDRAIADDAPAGHARFLLSKGRIIGASIVGAHAGELIHEVALAMQLGAKAKQLSELVHAYPTYAQLNRRTINSTYAGLLQSRKVRLLVWLLNRLIP